MKPSRSFEKINKNTKLLARWVKKKQTQITKIMNEKGVSLPFLQELETYVSEQYEQITEFKRKLLVKHKLPSCIKYQTKRENQNRPIQENKLNQNLKSSTSIPLLSIYLRETKNVHIKTYMPIFLTAIIHSSQRRQQPMCAST